MGKTYLNETKILFPSLSQNEAFARAAAASFCAQLNPTCDELSDIKCAVSEAVTNAIVHGYRSAIGEITLIFRIGEDGCFTRRCGTRAAVSVISKKPCVRCLPRIRKMSEAGWDLRLSKISWILSVCCPLPGRGQK